MKPKEECISKKTTDLTLAEKTVTNAEAGTTIHGVVRDTINIRRTSVKSVIKDSTIGK
jgi:hypothetical protein